VLDSEIHNFEPVIYFKVAGNPLSAGPYDGALEEA